MTPHTHVFLDCLLLLPDAHLAEIFLLSLMHRTVVFRPQVGSGSFELLVHVRLVLHLCMLVLFLALY